MEIVNLNKKVYAKNQYEKVIDTKFSQLATTPTSPTPVELPTVSVEKFFSDYNQIFFQIPKLGETNSHEYLVKKSSEYIGATQTNDDIQALIEEINNLQAQNLELNQQLVELKISNTSTSSSISANAAATAAVEVNNALQAVQGRG